MIREKYYLSSLFAFVTLGCLMTSVFLKINLNATGSERRSTPMTSDPVFKGNPYNVDVISHKSIWMAELPDSYSKEAVQPLSAVKSMVILGAALSFIAFLLTFVQPILNDRTVACVCAFFANVSMSLTGIYLLLCAGSYVAARLEPKNVIYVDQNTIGMLDVITLITAIFSMLLYLQEKRNNVAPKEKIFHI